MKTCLVSIFLLISIGHAFADVIYDAESEILFSEFIPCAKNESGELATGSVSLHAFVEKITNAPSGAGYSGTLKSTGGMLSGTVSGERYFAVKVPDDSFTQDAVGLPVTFAIIKDYKMVGETSGVVFTINVTVHLKLNEQNEVSLEATDVQVSCG
jgi:hypothetical protein